MKKCSKIILIIFFAQVFIVAPLFARAITQNDYTSTPEKIYKRIDTITFTFSGTALHYGVTMGSKFQSVNATHARLRFDIFINTDDTNYVTNLKVNLTYAVTFTINNVIYVRTGNVSDTSSSFFQTGDLLYTFEACYVDIPMTGLFPASVAITFNYIFQGASSIFTHSGSASASATFLGSTIITIIICGIVAVVVLAIVFGVRAAKRRQANRYKARAALARPGFQAGTQAPVVNTQGMNPPYHTPSPQTGVPARAIDRTNQPGNAPSSTPSPTICPACGGNVVNFKCQSCWGKICRGCGQLNMTTSNFCEKCGKTL